VSTSERPDHELEEVCHADVKQAALLSAATFLAVLAAVLLVVFLV
jgi:hypothetical protein